MPDRSLILVIDDSLLIRTLVTCCLRRAGYDVLTSSNAVDALCWLKEQQTAPPALVVLDLLLPRLDGFDCARLLRQQKGFASIPILILSCRDSVLDRLRAGLAGAKSYMTKPFRVEDLVAAVRDLLADASYIKTKGKTDAQ